MSVRLLYFLLSALLLTACGGAPTSGGVPSTSLADLVGTYNGDLQINDKDNSVFMNGLVTFTISGDTLSGTVRVDDDFDFPNDTGTLSGKLKTTSRYAYFDANLSVDFSAAPDYTADGSIVYAEGSRSISGNLTLRRDDTFVGSAIILGDKE